MLDNCKLDILDQLPERMQRICISFLSNMSREGIESLSHGGEGKHCSFCIEDYFKSFSTNMFSSE
jgi:hypothetical protein